MRRLTFSVFSHIFSHTIAHFLQQIWSVDKLEELAGLLRFQQQCDNEGSIHKSMC
jgi:hypothetical protein